MARSKRTRKTAGSTAAAPSARVTSNDSNNNRGANNNNSNTAAVGRKKKKQQTLQDWTGGPTKSKSAEGQKRWHNNNGEWSIIDLFYNCHVMLYAWSPCHAVIIACSTMTVHVTEYLLKCHHCFYKHRVYDTNEVIKEEYALGTSKGQTMQMQHWRLYKSSVQSRSVHQARG